MNRFKPSGRMVAFALPVIAGVVAGAALASSDLVAYVEGPLGLVVGVAGVVVGILAAAVVTIVSRRGRDQPAPVEVDEPSGPAANERLAMLSNLYDAVTARLVNVDARLSEALPDDEAEPVRREISRLEQFLFDVHGVASLHDVEPNLEPIEPAELVDSVIQRTSKAAADRTVKADIPLEPGVIRGDRRLLSLALINLVINAVKFSIPESPIVVRAIDRGDRLVFQVEDQGPGVPTGEEVWGELARGSNAAGVPGAGLGLPLVRLVAEAHGGSAHLDSSPSGTVATLELPRR